MGYAENIKSLADGEAAQPLTVAESRLLSFDTAMNIGAGACAAAIENDPSLKTKPGFLAEQIETSTGVDFPIAALCALAATNR